MKKIAGIDIQALPLLGRGTQGAVYKIDTVRCIKIFKSTQDCQDEVKTLLLTQKDPHFPKLFEHGKKYIIREYIEGLELNHYLTQFPLTSQLSQKLLCLYEAMVQAGFTRWDAALFHILVTPSEELRLIDTAKALRKKATCPKLILQGLERCGYQKFFLDYVATTRPDLILQWKKHVKI